MNEGYIVKQGHLRRLKTQKRRYFVLRSPCNGTARLEYFENERKFHLQSSPKRIINLTNCFNIARKEDPKNNRLAFALYTRDDVFGLIADTEEDMTSWMMCLREEQSKSEKCSDYMSMWHVTVKDRGLGTSKNLVGQYDLKLTSQSLVFMKRETTKSVKEIKLVNIRRCGHTNNFFFMELGRSAITGPGELWMHVDDLVIAQNMHEAILGTMQNLSMTDLSPQGRLRMQTGGPRGCAHRGRPASAVIIPANRARAGSMPDSPSTRRRTVSSSTNRLSSSIGVGTKFGKSTMFSRFLQKRRTREENWSSPILKHVQSKSISIDVDLHRNLLGRAHSVLDFTLLTSLESPANGLGSSDFTKSCNSLISSSPPGPVFSLNTRNGNLPSMEQRDYVNSDPREIGDSDDYMKMGGNAANNSKTVPEVSNYMDMEQGTKKGAEELATFEPARGTQSQESSCTNQDIPDITSRKTEEIKRTNSSSSSGTSEGRGAELRELVNIKPALKSAPKSFPAGQVRRASSQDYIAMAPGTLRSNEARCYVNYPPESQPEASNVGDERESRCYMNICPGEGLESPGSDSVFDRSYVNFDPSQQLNFDQVDNASCYQNGAHQTYVNVVPGQSLEDEHLSEDAPESRYYVNIGPGKAFSDASRLSSDVRRMKIRESPPRSPTREYVNVDFSENLPHLTEDASENPNDERAGYIKIQPGGRQSRNTPVSPAYYGSSRGKRRESEPAQSYSSNVDRFCMDSDESRMNYVILDLDKRSPACSPKRQRPPDLRLRGSNIRSCGPKSAPAYKSYVEIDFTKSQGLRQARLKGRENSS